jgi:hypothetical protein
MPHAIPLSNTHVRDTLYRSHYVAAAESRFVHALAGTRHRRTYICWVEEEDWYVEAPSTL